MKLQGLLTISQDYSVDPQIYFLKNSSNLLTSAEGHHGVMENLAPQK